MKFPAYGRSLYQRRMNGERIRVVCLMVGNTWKLPKGFAIPPEVPKIAVKTAAWNTPAAERYDWRLVADCTVLAVDTRGPDEREAGPEDWDPWLWLLSHIQLHARDVLRFTITEQFTDPPNAFAAERELECLAWCSAKYEDGKRVWPPWWPYGRAIHDRNLYPAETAA
jgi:hypothetical protein